MNRIGLPQVTPGDRVTHVFPGTEVAVESLPKISLHDHLDGGVRPSTIVELAAADGIAVPATTPDELNTWVRANADSGNLVDYLATFSVTLSVMQSAANLERIAREFVEDLIADGVVYGEIRWAPELHVENGLGLRDAIDAVQRGIDSAVGGGRDAGRVIQIGQLLCAMRQADRADEIADLAIEYRGRGVVGFDIAGPEIGFPASRLASACAKLDEAWVPRTVHAGEADGLASIEGALLDGRALRLGHGVRITDDLSIVDGGTSNNVTLGTLSEWVRDRRIALEICPTSNVHTNAFARFGSTILEHPFDILYQLGFAVTVNTDNRLMSGTSLSREIANLGEAFGYTLDDVLQWQLNAADATFLPVEDRDELTRFLLSAYSA
jgi:adenosine deaminase